MTAYTARQLATNLIQNPITQASHGFSIGNLLRFNGTIYVLAEANNATNAELIGIVNDVLDVNTFTISQMGYISIPAAALTPGTLYYLHPSSPGTVTATQPVIPGQVSLPCFIADTATSGYFFASVGELIKANELFAWNVITTNTNMAVNNGYIATSGGTLNLTLPTVSGVGDTIQITNSTGEFDIVQAAGQSIQFNAVTTTVGVGGSITSTSVGSALTIVCTVANDTWIVISAIGGPFTVV